VSSLRPLAPSVAAEVSDWYPKLIHDSSEFVKRGLKVLQDRFNLVRERRVASPEPGAILKTACNKSPGYESVSRSASARSFP
jgi:hypothetical protein